MTTLIARQPAGKFVDPTTTLDGSRRARVAPTRLDTLWFNTGTLCNLTCVNCYIESSPTNDRLSYLRHAEVTTFLEQADRLPTRPTTIGFTGGEPFMNPEFMPMLEEALGRGYRALVLTNAMKPMQKLQSRLADLQQSCGDRLTIRVSVDHHTRALHERERGPRAWQPMLKGLIWLSEAGFNLHVAGRGDWGEDEDTIRRGFARLFKEHGIRVNAADPEQLVLFPELDEHADVPEITEACWGILDVSPTSPMCANSRMVVRRKGAPQPAVVACTLIAYDPRFEMGATLEDALVPVSLNHPHCARFCVLGGGSCTT